MRTLLVAPTLVALMTLSFASAAFADTKITDRAYVRHDGGSDATIADCNNDATTPALGGDGAGERQQNEPTVAIDPTNTMHMTGGANDYCTVQTIGDAWAGFYYSNGGATWTNSLLPGYPTDTSALGQASPLFQFVGGAGDPVQSWDRNKHLYYGGIAFNRAHPQNGSIWLARYKWPDSDTSPTYEFTTLVSRGTPGVFGIFEDKVQVEADKGLSSLHQGNVYMCWARFTGNGGNAIEFARSTDGGLTFDIQRISDGIHGNQFCDIGVTKSGMVFVSWRQFEANPQGKDTPQKQDDAVVFVTSTNGGARFTKPQVAFEFIRWDMQDRTLSGGRARDCGDGPLACQSGYVFGRADSGPRLTTDPVAGDGDEAYVVIEATVPGSETPTGSTYGTVTPGVGSQGSIYFSKTTNGGATWSTPTLLDPQTRGHQFYPDIDIDNNVIYAVYHDSRNDNASGPPTTPSGGDYRTVPFGNRWVVGAAKSVAGFGLETWYSSSSDGGATWSHAKGSSGTYLQNYEQFGNRDVPFFGDYNYVDVVGTKVAMTWTDSRETRPGEDPRYTDGNGTDGFDVWQCRVQNADRTWSADGCPNAGGNDQNIFGLILN